MGCMNLSFGTGKTKDIDEAIKIICTAFDQGITFFDIAEAYGSFTNEKVVGESLKPIRKEVILATKFGMISEIGVNSHPNHIRKVVDESLQRLSYFQNK
jgi:aryl-alcohol dehydrogenase-like predicted oxidoreductase